MKLDITPILVCLVIVFVSFSTFSQTMYGKEFWFAYIDGGISEPILHVLAHEEDVEGEIIIESLNYNQNFSISAGNSETFILPEATSTPYEEGIHENVVFVQACADITLTALKGGPSSADASLIFPKKFLGEEYTILCLSVSFPKIIPPIRDTRS